MRIKARYLVKRPARLLVDGNVHEGQTQDMHETGIRVRLSESSVDESLLGHAAVIEVYFEDRGWVRIPGTVRRIIGADVGLSFEILKAEGQDGATFTLDELIPPSAPML